MKVVLTSCVFKFWAVGRPESPEMSFGEMKWINPPQKILHERPSIQISSEELIKGVAWMEKGGNSLVMFPPELTDFWSRTYYEPLLKKSNAPALLLDIDSRSDRTISIEFSIEAVSQFDQAGLLIYLDDDHWLKCGIEFCDGQHRLSAVVCNIFSDWSACPWPTSAARLRIHRKCFSSSICVEAAAPGSEAFEFIRIAHLSDSTHHDDVPTPPVAGSPIWRVGPYACSPSAQRGFSASFSSFSCTERLAMSHSDRLDH